MIMNDLDESDPSILDIKHREMLNTEQLGKGNVRHDDEYDSEEDYELRRR